ncbi:MAG: branched-chain amino acid ABC transporter substrate-binding protein [Phascolarctobacterium sp.]|nr:branched-chain amino acid ABC transporter substrate-binding protein [Phascolarctobacterium sp.]
MSLFAGCSGEKKQEVVKIGFLAPLTGGNAALGIGLKNSAQLAVDTANASGKYPYKFELVAADDGGDPSTAVAAANKLIADKSIVAVAGHFNSGCALATAPVFHKNSCALVIASAIHPDITEKGYKEITRVMTHLNVQNEYAGERAAKEWGVKTICLINDRTDYGKTNAEQFAWAAVKNVATVLFEDGIAVGQQNFSAVLTNIKAKNPDAIYFGGVVTEAALIRRQMKDLPMDCLMFFDSGIISGTFNKIAAPAADGVIAFNIEKPLAELPGGKKFMEDYAKAKFAAPYENYGHFGYDAVGVIMDAVNRAKSTDRAKVIDVLRATKGYHGVIGETTFDEKGQTQNKLITAFISEDGKWLSYEKADLQIVDKKIVKK